MPRSELFPDIAPYDSGHLPVESPHELYWEQSGNRKGIPVLFLHGGPGAGATPAHRRFFDPRDYRIVVFDQRGAGRSRPLGEIAANATADLVADIERLRGFLGIERWAVFGGSWGSSLALAYAEAHPGRVSALFLRGIFLCRRSEVDWFLYGMRQVFPEIWQEFAGHLPPAERDDLLENYYRRLVDPSPRVHMPAAKAWSRYEGACSTLLPSAETLATFGDPVKALGLARIEAHYFRHGCFMEDGALLDGAARIAEIPGVIVQGRYDMVCPAVSAFELAAVWRRAEMIVVPDAGHSAMEPGIRAALVAATERFKDRLRGG